MRGETKSLVAQAGTDEPDDVQFGWRQRCPAAGRAFALAAAALGVGDRFAGGQRGALGPCRLEVGCAQCITKRRDRGIVPGVIDLEPDRTHAFPQGLRRAE